MANVHLSVAVVIIFYRNELEWFEIISLMQVTKKLGNHHIIAVMPRGCNPIGLELLPKHAKRCEFDQKWFKSRSSYNKLLLNPDFYAKFNDFEKILIYQLDAFVFADQLSEFSSMEYDYIGAPWLSGELIQRYNFPFSVQLSKIFNSLNPQLECYVGNGGFSLRNPLACQKLLAKSSYFERNLSLNEDGFFAFQGLKYKNVFKVAPLEIAVDFAWENEIDRCYERNHYCLPFGCHAWQLFEHKEFITPYLKDYILSCPTISVYIDQYLAT